MTDPIKTLSYTVKLSPELELAEWLEDPMFRYNWIMGMAGKEREPWYNKFAK